MMKFHDAAALVAALQPDEPVTLLRPHAAARAGRHFLEHFPGTALYAVKANPTASLLDTLWATGITHFDVASPGEVALVRSRLPQATLCFMNPVKSERAIAEAYARHGVKTFSLDGVEELDKILAATQRAQDLALCVRLRVASDHARQPMSAKFGVASDRAATLLQACRPVAQRLGVSFHVGSQAMSPRAYTGALAQAQAVVLASGVAVDFIDVGGGFPSIYPDMEPPPLALYFDAIRTAFDHWPSARRPALWCEPGRALCAEYTSLLVRVHKRRGHELYINDGAYGALSEAGHLGWRFPVERVSPTSSAPRVPFAFYGPTCDEVDHMAGPFLLPADTGPGDYIEVGMLGAYGCALRTGFNGFGAAITCEVTDEPMASTYAPVLPAAARASRARATGRAQATMHAG